MSKRRAHNHDHNKPSKRARIDAASEPADGVFAHLPREMRQEMYTWAWPDLASLAGLARTCTVAARELGEVGTGLLSIPTTFRDRFCHFLDQHAMNDIRAPHMRNKARSRLQRLVGYLVTQRLRYDRVWLAPFHVLSVIRPEISGNRTAYSAWIDVNLCIDMDIRGWRHLAVITAGPRVVWDTGYGGWGFINKFDDQDDEGIISCGRESLPLFVLVALLTNAETMVNALPAGVSDSVFDAIENARQAYADFNERFDHTGKALDEYTTSDIARLDAHYKEKLALARVHNTAVEDLHAALQEIPQGLKLMTLPYQFW